MSFAASSINISIDIFGILSAECANMEGEYIESTLDLNECIGVIGGELVPGVEGFARSNLARGLELVDDGRVLRAEVLDENMEEWRIREICLDEFIENVDGKLTLTF